MSSGGREYNEMTMKARQKMKVVGLVSGGKDSCYNLMCAKKDGHEVVALANLHPEEGAPDELDSYMYQSVGQDGVKLYAEAAGLPLYRRPITGKPMNLAANYEKTSGDEVEDLFELLKEVKEHHPDAEAVSAGAIFSAYQKQRVEEVCARLGLTPLAYLWERDQVPLLDEMIAAGVNAILIKVAAVGLGREHLGKSIKEVRDTLVSLSEKYGVHACGEGGEFETFVLDCPLFQKRLQLLKFQFYFSFKQNCRLDESHVVVHQDDPIAPVFYLKLDSISVHDK